VAGNCHVSTGRSVKMMHPKVRRGFGALIQDNLSVQHLQTLNQCPMEEEPEKPRRRGERHRTQGKQLSHPQQSSIPASICMHPFSKGIVATSLTPRAAALHNLLQLFTEAEAKKRRSRRFTFRDCSSVWVLGRSLGGRNLKGINQSR
jgi:hypothetical protein